jgi:hypothetical protein
MENADRYAVPSKLELDAPRDLPLTRNRANALDAVARAL